MAIRKTQVLVIIAIAGIVALTLIGACMMAGDQGPAYARINVSDKSAVYLQFERGMLRAATSAEGLATAEPVPMRSVNFEAAHSKAFTLPIPADELPDGVIAVKGSFTRYGDRIEAQLGFCRTDAQNAVWQCDVLVWFQPGRTAATAKAIHLPDPQRLALVVRTAPSYRKLGIGVQLMAGDNFVSGLYRDGKAVPVQVSVTDEKGNEAAGKKGLLADFGFT